MLEY
jgi:lysozyme